MPIIKTDGDRLNQVGRDYLELLAVFVDGLPVEMPDPETLTDGWVGEAEGVHMWPPSSYVNISQYPIEREVKDLLSRLGNDYKEDMITLSAHVIAI